MIEPESETALRVADDAVAGFVDKDFVSLGHFVCKVGSVMFPEKWQDEDLAQLAIKRETEARSRARAVVEQVRTALFEQKVFLGVLYTAGQDLLRSARQPSTRKTLAEEEALFRASKQERLAYYETRDFELDDISEFEREFDISDRVYPIDPGIWEQFFASLKGNKTSNQSIDYRQSTISGLSLSSLLAGFTKIQVVDGNKKEQVVVANARNLHALIHSGEAVGKKVTLDAFPRLQGFELGRLQACILQPRISMNLIIKYPVTLGVDASRLGASQRYFWGEVVALAWRYIAISQATGLDPSPTEAVTYVIKFLETRGFREKSDNIKGCEVIPSESAIKTYVYAVFRQWKDQRLSAPIIPPNNGKTD